MFEGFYMIFNFCDLELDELESLRFDSLSF